jgi:hypothetical protein
VIVAFEWRDDDACQRILNTLETVNSRFREAIEKGITVVEAGGNESIGEEDGGVYVEGGADLAKKTNVEVRGLADGGDVFLVGQVRVKDDTEVAGRVGGNNR